MDHSKVYTYDTDELLAPETLCFTLLVTAPYMDSAEVRAKLADLRRYLDIELRPYVEHYPWHVRPVEHKLVDDGHLFVYGELEYGESMTDLWTVASLLFKFTSRDENMYLHLHDQDREFLLIEAAEEVPEWLEPDCASNRVWINQRRVVCMPPEYCEGRSPSFEEALAFLQTASYRLEVLHEVTACVARVCTGYPEEALKRISLETVLVKPSTARKLVAQKMYVVGAAVAEYMDSVRMTGVKTQRRDDEELVHAKIRVNAIVHAELEQYGQTAAGKGELIDLAMEDNDGEAGAIEQLEEYNKTIESDPLQTELLRYNIIDQRVDWEPLEPLEDEKETYEDDLVEKLKRFMEEGENEDPVSEAEDDGDDEVDEDDFFEFFCREALHLSGEELEQMRAGDSVPSGADLETLQNLARAVSGNSPAATLLNNLK
ncbi:hypothetical protein OGAPHI_001237 [Ogataea philodendri]|uniref:Uncharacterized protein n=1 Tax=Ogataea philodendri TaxID=1378263 RepID=A0A9P8PGA0_9ASCO|nr:uncharacterized protein OGAPHI_001237 [Ogataea philodendri]KAH3670722.1 hypothetical protein OGAPHI_001237 [Ogataea philodendri]